MIWIVIVVIVFVVLISVTSDYGDIGGETTTFGYVTWETSNIPASNVTVRRFYRDHITFSATETGRSGPTGIRGYYKLTATKGGTDDFCTVTHPSSQAAVFEDDMGPHPKRFSQFDARCFTPTERSLGIGTVVYEGHVVAAVGPGFPVYSFVRGNEIVTLDGPLGPILAKLGGMQIRITGSRSTQGALVVQTFRILDPSSFVGTLERSDRSKIGSSFLTRIAFPAGVPLFAISNGIDRMLIRTSKALTMKHLVPHEGSKIWVKGKVEYWSEALYPTVKLGVVGFLT